MVRGRNTAVLLVDVINPFDFEGSEHLLEHALRVLPALLRLRRAAHRAGVPVIYANDNFGDWRSESSRIVARCLKGEGRRFVKSLAPLARDYFVLKARNSAFFCTALPPLLEELRVQRLVVAGLSTDNCVLFTAHDAYLRGFKVAVPRDCVAAQSEAATDRALEQMSCAVKADTRASTALRFVPRKD
jgi:nicotinamidase-related amidase